MITLSPSLLSIDFINIKSELDVLKSCGIDHLHLDVMDGAFVPSISFGMPFITSLRKHSDMFLDVHMMVEEPQRYIEAMVEAGADGITIHAEACMHLDRTLEQIRSFDKKVGVAINPATPILLLDEVLPHIDMVLVMSVNPGFGGQQFIPYTRQKISRLSDIRENNDLKFSIQVDGGVNSETLGDVLEAGADNIVIGSAIFSGDTFANIKLLKGIIEESE